MSKTVKLTVRIEEEMNQAANRIAKEHYGVPLATILKLFLKAFTTQKGVGFFIGDDHLSRMFEVWLFKKRLQKNRKAYFNVSRVNNLMNYNP